MYNPTHTTNGVAAVVYDRLEEISRKWQERNWIGLANIKSYYEFKTHVLGLFRIEFGPSVDLPNDTNLVEWLAAAAERHEALSQLKSALIANANNSKPLTVQQHQQQQQQQLQHQMYMNNFHHQQQQINNHSKPPQAHQNHSTSQRQQQLHYHPNTNNGSVSSNGTAHYSHLQLQQQQHQHHYYNHHQRAESPRMNAGTPRSAASPTPPYSSIPMQSSSPSAHKPPPTPSSSKRSSEVSIQNIPDQSTTSTAGTTPTPVAAASTVAIPNPDGRKTPKNSSKSLSTKSSAIPKSLTPQPHHQYYPTHTIMAAPTHLLTPQSTFIDNTTMSDSNSSGSSKQTSYINNNTTTSSKVPHIPKPPSTPVLSDNNNNNSSSINSARKRSSAESEGNINSGINPSPSPVHQFHEASPRPLAASMSSCPSTPPATTQTHQSSAMKMTLGSNAKFKYATSAEMRNSGANLLKHGPSVIQKDGRSSQSFVQKEPFNSKLPQQQSTGMNDYESPHQFYKSMNLLQYKQQQQASKSAPSTAPLDKKKNVKSTAQGSTENSTTEESASEDSNQAMDSDIEITGFTMSGTTASMGASTCRPSHGKVSSLAQEVSSFSVAKMPTATLPPSSALPKGSLIPAAPATSAQITNSSIPQATNNAAAELTRKRAIFPPFFIISPELEKLFESGLRRTRDLEEIVCPVAIPDKSHFWSVLTEFEAETRLGKRRRILL